MRRIFILSMIASIFVGVGCGHSLNKHADKMDKVQLKTDKTVTGASVKTEDSNNSGLAGAVSQAAGGAASIKLKEKFNKHFSSDDVVALVDKTVREELESGDPFKIDDNGKDGRLNVTIYGYGMKQEGSSPVFTVTYTSEIYYNGSGEEKEVWDDTYQCDRTDLWQDSTGAGEDVGYFAHVMNMSDEEFKSQVEQGFKRCTRELVETIRKDARGG